MTLALIFDPLQMKFTLIQAIIRQQRKDKTPKTLKISSVYAQNWKEHSTL